VGCGRQVIAQATTDILLAVVSAQAGAIVALAVTVSRLRERLARLEEWVRVQEQPKPRPPGADR
jgi:hypothetical protein